MSRKILIFLLISFAALQNLAAEVLPDTLMVCGRCAMADAGGMRVLVSVADDDEAIRMPATLMRNGQHWTVQTTTLPIVALYHDSLTEKEFGNGSITIASPDGTAVAYGSMVRYRGMSSLVYEKKNYAIKLLDEQGESLDASILGMRSDNSWILDAMAADVARMRNRVSTDIWLDFSQKPYYAASEPALLNGTRGKFVEMFVGGRYWGIYCLTEKVDRKQLRLKKFSGSEVRGVGYKSFAYDTLRQPGEAPSATDSTWMGWEPLYPDPTKDEPMTWQPLYGLAQFLSQPEGSPVMKAELPERVDLPLWNDYTLFIDLFHGDDNAAKNMIVYFRDITDPSVRACVCPWDMDATWGRAWNAEPVSPESNCNIANGVNYHVFLSLADGFGRQCERWYDLRSSAFTSQTLWPYFERYFSLFRSSGAARREVERWSGVDGIVLDFDAEEQYIREWLERRLAYLDKDYLPPMTGISSPLPDAAASPVYTLDGRFAGFGSDHLPGGVYIVNGKKIIR